MKKTNASVLTLIIFILSCYWSCTTNKPATLPVVVPIEPISENPDAEQAFKQAAALFEREQWEQAESAFGAFEQNFPNDLLVSSANVYRARIAIVQKDYLAARALLTPIANDSNFSNVTLQAGFYEGIVLFHLQKYTETIKKLGPYVGRMTDPTENKLLLNVLWQSAKQTKDLKKTILWLDDYLLLINDSSERKTLLLELKTTVELVKDQQVLTTLSEKLIPNNQPWLWVNIQLATLLYENGQEDAASNIINQLFNAGFNREPKIIALKAAIEKALHVDMGTIGCILPLSGRSRLAGEEVLKGVMLGSRTAQIGTHNKPLSVALRDSAGSPAAAARAVEELVTQENVFAIIGPMDNNSSIAAARKAEALNIPLISLSTNNQIGNIGSNIFRNFASGLTEVKALIKHAEKNKKQQHAILYPQNAYGTAMKKTYRELLGQKNKQLAAEIAYSPEQTTFTSQVEALSKKQFDVLFIPDISSRLALIAPALAAAGIWPASNIASPNQEPAIKTNKNNKTALYLIPSVGLSEDLVRRAGRYLQQAIFATYYHQDASTNAKEFELNYQDTYGKAPTVYAAFGYDAVQLLAQSIKTGSKTRTHVKQWLKISSTSDTLNASLAIPYDGFDPAGEPNALPHLMSLQAKQLVVVE